MCVCLKQLLQMIVVQIFLTLKIFGKSICIGIKSNKDIQIYVPINSSLSVLHISLCLCKVTSILFNANTFSAIRYDLNKGLRCCSGDAK